MKKIFAITLAILAFGTGLSAQNITFSEDIDVTYGNDVFVVQPLSYIGYGYHFSGNGMTEEQKAFNSEFFFNVMELGLRPASWLGIYLGVDYDLDVYRLDDTHFWGAEAGNTVWKRSLGMSTFSDVKTSKLLVHSLTIPLSLEFKAGKCAARVGVAGEYNLPATVRNKLLSGTDLTKDRVTGIPTKDFGYSLFGALSYGGLGIYARYRPVAQFEDGVGPAFTTFTVGGVIGLGF